jgi:hypothetical protein
MAKKKIENVCGYSCSGCDHHGNECPGCETTKGKPFWTPYVSLECCPVYDCCVTGRKLPHCGKCPELMCERFTRLRDPEISDEEAAACLAAMEANLRARR